MTSLLSDRLHARSDRFRCTADLSAPPENLFEIPDIPRRVVRVEVAEKRTAFDLSRVSDDPCVVQAQKMLGGDLRNFQCIEVLCLDRHRHLLECLPRRALWGPRNGRGPGFRHYEEEMPPHLRQGTLDGESVHPSEHLPVPVLLGLEAHG